MPSSIQPNMRVLVIFHVYYEQFVGYYLDKMHNIHSCEWDLIVTGDNLSPETKERIREVNGGAVFLDCGNVGYDVWPFIAGIKSVNLDLYDIVIKLHTKNEDGKKFRLHGEFMTGAQWRAYMVDALMKDEETFGKLLDMFSDNGKLGIAYSQKLDFKSRGGSPEDCEMLSSELERLGVDRKSDDFCAGTMFAVRACAVKFLQREDINEECFEQSGPSHGSSSMAHVYERLIPICIVSSGYEIELIPASRLSALVFRIKDVIGPPIKWLVSVDYYGKDSTKRLKLFGQTIRLKR